MPDRLIGHFPDAPPSLAAVLAGMETLALVEVVHFYVVLSVVCSVGRHRVVNEGIGGNFKTAA